MHMTELTGFSKKPHQSIQRKLRVFISNCHEYATKTTVVETVDVQLFQTSRTWRIVPAKEGHVPRPRSTEGLAFVLFRALQGQAYPRESCAEESKTWLTMKHADLSLPGL